MRMIYMKDNKVGYMCPDKFLKDLLELDVFCELPTVKITTATEVTQLVFDGFIKKFKKVEEKPKKVVKKTVKKRNVKKRATKKVSKKQE
jgi:hypothetical protein